MKITANKHKVRVGLSNYGTIQDNYWVKQLINRKWSTWWFDSGYLSIEEVKN